VISVQDIDRDAAPTLDGPIALLRRERLRLERRVTAQVPRHAIRSSRLDVPESRQLPARCASVPAGRVVPGPDGDA
jgi:hypothetical protein